LFPPADLVFYPTLAYWDRRLMQSHYRPSRLAGHLPAQPVRLTPKPRHAHSRPKPAAYVDPFDRDCLGLEATASQPQTQGEL